jgi:hypothetical protein
MRTTWKGSCELKAAVVESLTKHYEHDNIVRNFGYIEFDEVYKWNELTQDYDMKHISSISKRGCALGCTLVPFNISIKDLQSIESQVEAEHKHWYRAVASKFGFPTWLSSLEEIVFESLPENEAPEWPLPFVKAIPVGVPYKELKVRVLDELISELRKNGIKGTKNAGVTCQGGQGTSVDSRWQDIGESESSFTRDIILDLLKGVEIDIPSPCDTIEVGESQPLVTA